MSQLQQREDTLIVVHQSVLSLLLATWLGGPVAAMWHFPFSHDAYTVVEDRGGYWVLRVFNGRSVWQTENLGELYCINPFWCYQRKVGLPQPQPVHAKFLLSRWLLSQVHSSSL